MPDRLTYNPAIFDTPDLEDAKRIILTHDGVGTDTRWERETPYLADLLGSRLGLTEQSVVIDYGCGVGRLSKALIERFNCVMLGVDISQDMRGLAPGYVDSMRFSVVSRGVLDSLVAHGFRADAAISVWVLQHCANPREDLGLLHRGLRAGAPIGIVNTNVRCVPTVEAGFASDGLDLRELLSKGFDVLETGDLDPAHTGELTAEHSFWGVYRNRA